MRTTRHRHGGIVSPHVYPVVDESARVLRRLAIRMTVIVLLVIAIVATLGCIALRDHQAAVEQAYRQGLLSAQQGAQSCRRDAI